MTSRFSAAVILILSPLVMCMMFIFYSGLCMWLILDGQEELGWKLFMREVDHWKRFYQYYTRKLIEG